MFKFCSLFHFAVGSVLSDEFDPLSNLSSCSIIPGAMLTMLDPVTLVTILFRLSHSLSKTSLQSPLTIWGVQYMLVLSVPLPLAALLLIPKEYDSDWQRRFKMIAVYCDKDDVWLCISKLSGYVLVSSTALATAALSLIRKDDDSQWQRWFTMVASCLLR